MPDELWKKSETYPLDYLKTLPALDYKTLLSKDQWPQSDNWELKVYLGDLIVWYLPRANIGNIVRWSKDRRRWDMVKIMSD